MGDMGRVTVDFNFWNRFNSKGIFTPILGGVSGLETPFLVSGLETPLMKELLIKEPLIKEPREEYIKRNIIAYNKFIENWRRMGNTFSSAETEKNSLSAMYNDESKLEDLRKVDTLGGTFLNEMNYNASDKFGYDPNTLNGMTNLIGGINQAFLRKAEIDRKDPNDLAAQIQAGRITRDQANKQWEGVRMSGYSAPTSANPDYGRTIKLIKENQAKRINTSQDMSVVIPRGTRLANPDLFPTGRNGKIAPNVHWETQEPAYAPMTAKGVRDAVLASKGIQPMGQYGPNYARPGGGAARPGSGAVSLKNGQIRNVNGRMYVFINRRWAIIDQKFIAKLRSLNPPWNILTQFNSYLKHNLSVK